MCRLMIFFDVSFCPGGYKKGHSDHGHHVIKKGDEDEKKHNFFDEDGDEDHDEKKGNTIDRLQENCCSG